jgi:predicted RNase H-like nuclease (RuvC/YqgF family)
MDENTNVTPTETNDSTLQPETKVETTPKADDKPTKSVEEQIQQLMVENAKLKRAVDKSSSEAADYKKKYNATLSEKEQADLEKAEEQARRDERLAELERENSIHKFTEQYLDLGYDKESAINAATAQVDGDVDTLFKLQKKVIDEKVLAKEQELIKDIPRARTGVYASMTAEQILAIPDREERYKAMQENIQLFQ